MTTLTNHSQIWARLLSRKPGHQQLHLLTTLDTSSTQNYRCHRPQPVSRSLQKVRIRPLFSIHQRASGCNLHGKERLMLTTHLKSQSSMTLQVILALGQALERDVLWSSKANEANTQVTQSALAPRPPAPIALVPIALDLLQEHRWFQLHSNQAMSNCMNDSKRTCKGRVITDVHLLVLCILGWD